MERTFLKSELQKRLVDTLPGGIVIYKIGETIETQYFSDGILKLSGHSREEYEALVKRNTEVEVPMPVYRMLLDAVEVKGEQLPNGDLMFREVPAYNVTYLGNLD